MSDDKSEYPAMLVTLQPHDAITVLESRLKQIGRLNHDIADWLQERRKIEEQYAAGLRRLAKRAVVGDLADLGVFSTPWSNLVEGVDTLAESHSLLARKIQSDIEGPLRDYHTSSHEYLDLVNAPASLTHGARELEHARRRADKSDHKSSKSQTNKMAYASEDLDTARAQWESLAPPIFEKLQVLDENRMVHLRDLLTQFQTHEMDQIERDRQPVERSLNTLVQVETADEIKTFALRTLSQKPTAPGPASSERRHSRASGIVSSPNAASFSPSVHGESPSVKDSPSGDTVPDLPSQKTDKPRGFRRLGTVLSRRRHSKMPAGADRFGELGDSPSAKRENRRSMMPMMQSSSTFANLTSKMSRSRTDLNLNPPQDQSTERPRSPLRTMSSMTESTTHPQTPAVNGDRPELDRGRSSETAPRLPDPLVTNPSLTSLQNAVDASQNQVQTPLAPRHTAPTPYQPMPLGQNPRQGPNVPLGQGPSQSQAEETWSGRAELDDPISRAQREAAGEGTPNQLNVNIRDAPTREAGDADALASLANTLKLQAPTIEPRKTGTVRGRRDMRASVYSPGTLNPFGVSSVPGDSSVTGLVTSEIRPHSQGSALPKSVSTPFLSQPVSSTPFSVTPDGPKTSSSTTFPDGPKTSSSTTFPPQLPPAMRQNSLMEDSGSVRSGRSLGSTTSQAHRHPEPEDPGLSASVIETVSAWFENGQVTRGLMIGEVALGYKPDSTEQSSAMIRLDNFANLDKVAPNPAFVSSDTDVHHGCYKIDYKSLGTRSQIAFKYQVHLPSDTIGPHAPILLTPAWKIDGSTTSVILSVSLNPAFEFKSGSMVTLKNVNLALYLGDGSRALSCQSKPQGVFNKDRNCIYWALGEVVLKAGVVDVVKTLLARFSTEGTAKEGRVDAKWECDGMTGSGVRVLVAKSGGRGGEEEDPFSDADGTGNGGVVGDDHGKWEGVKGARKVVAGTYTAS